jgi:hypothetical protein
VRLSGGVAQIFNLLYRGVSLRKGRNMAVRIRMFWHSTHQSTAVPTPKMRHCFSSAFNLEKARLWTKDSRTDAMSPTGYAVSEMNLGQLSTTRSVINVDGSIS